MSGRVRFILLIVGLLLLFGAGFLIGRKTAHPEVPVPQVDTITIRDTIVDYKPQEAAIPAGFKLIAVSQIEDYEKALAEFRDSLSAKPKIVTYHDTSYIAVPISKYHFTDKKTYECEATGYDVKMLWHKSFQETKYITKTTEIPTLPKIAISPDFSAFVSKDVFFLGAGVKLDVWAGNWRFSPGIDYGLTWTGDKWSHGPAFTFSTNYNFIIR